MCFKPEDQADRIARMARDKVAKDRMGLPEYIGRFDLAIAKGTASLVGNIFNGRKDTTRLLLDLSGSNGDDAQTKARSQFGAFIDGTKKRGSGISRIASILHEPGNRGRAVNSPIQKHAPEMWNDFQEFAGDPEKAGRFSGRVIVSRGMSGATKSESAASFFLKALAGVGSLDATGKNMKSKVEGLLFGSDYANRDDKPASEQ